jgi:hypothetical protein
MLWEDQFYIDGKATAGMISELVPKVSPKFVAALAVYAREKMKLRHVPLLLVREMARASTEHKLLVADTLSKVVQRPDEMTEFLAIYWKEKKQPLSAQVKKGLAQAFMKFDEFQLSRYDKDGAVKLRDVMFLTHPKPKGKFETVYKKIAERKTQTVDTWETNLSAGKDKKESFERLMSEGKMGALAVLRNLRNMQEAGVELDKMREAIKTMKVERVLPFRFIAASRYAPKLEPELEEAMFKCLGDAPKLKGRTALVIDTSPSMWMANISMKSEMNRADAAAALAMLLREICESCNIYTFNHEAKAIPARRGFALRDAIFQTKGDYSCGGLGVHMANKDGYDRIVVLTDGQWHYSNYEANSVGTRHSMENSGHAGVCPKPLTPLAYMLNVAAYRNGVGSGSWVTIDGWSEAVVDYIRACEEGFDVEARG